MFEERDVPVFEFKYYEVDGSVTTKTFEVSTWPEAHEKFWEFLKGCGFVFDETVVDASTDAAENQHKKRPYRPY